MKQVKIIEGIMEMVQRLSNITATVMSKMKYKKNIHISDEQEKILEGVIESITGQLELLEKGIGKIGAQDRSKGNITYLETSEHIKQEQVLSAEENNIEVMLSNEAVGGEVNGSVQAYPIENLRKENKVVYIDHIPSVVRIDKKKGVIHKRMNGMKLEETYQIENKGSIHPLHRFVKLSIKRGMVHQREPTWTKWKEM